MLTAVPHQPAKNGQTSSSQLNTLSLCRNNEKQKVIMCSCRFTPKDGDGENRAYEFPLPRFSGTATITIVYVRNLPIAASQWRWLQLFFYVFLFHWVKSNHAFCLTTTIMIGLPDSVRARLLPDFHGRRKFSIEMSKKIRVLNLKNMSSSSSSLCHTSQRA